MIADMQKLEQAARLSMGDFQAVDAPIRVAPRRALVSASGLIVLTLVLGMLAVVAALHLI